MTAADLSIEGMCVKQFIYVTAYVNIKKVNNVLFILPHTLEKLANWFQVQQYQLTLNLQPLFLGNTSLQFIS